MQYKHKVTIIIITLILALGIFLLLARFNLMIGEVENLYDELEQKDAYHLQTTSEFIQNYNELYDDYNNLYLENVELKKQTGLDKGWQEFVVTAYTSQDEGCNSYSSLGINIEELAKHFRFCAVDPEIIPYGAVVLVQIDNGITPFLAADCGGAIKGNRLDLYFDTLENAFDFGKQTAMVKVIQ